MVAIYLTEEWTQVVRASVRHGAFNIISGDYLDPYLQDFVRSDAGQLVEMFREVQAITKTKDDEIHIVLPDYVFRLIGCYNDTENLDAEIKDDLRVPVDTCSLSYPIVINKKTSKKKTVCALDMSYINALISAAKQMKVAVVSIVPAGFVFLKATRKWEKEQMALFVSKNNASLISYNPLGGVFVQRLGNNLAFAKEKHNSEILNVVMSEVLATADFVNKQTFRMVNKNVPVYILADNFSDYFTLPSLQPRYADLPINNGAIPDVDDKEYREFLIPITVLHESFFPSGLASSKLSFMKVTSANVIPQDITQSSRRIMFRKAIKRWAKVAVVVGVGVVGLEAVGSFYFSSINIPNTLQSNYSEAQRKQEEISTELSRIHQWEAEDEDVINGLGALIESKPESIGFTDVEIGSKGSSNDAKKKKNWIRVSLKTKDPMVIQDYISRLTSNPVFDGVVVEEIAAESGKDEDIKRAKLVLGRAK